MHRQWICVALCGTIMAAILVGVLGDVRGNEPLGANGEAIRVTMEPRQAGGVLDPLARASTRRIGPEAAAPDGLELPEGVSNRLVFFRETFGGADVLFLLDTGRIPQVLYADTNRDGSLAGEEPHVGRQQEGGRPMVDFGPIALKPAEGVDAPGGSIVVSSMGGRGGVAALMVSPAEARHGTATLGERDVAFTLLDGNMNGLYNDVIAFPYPESPQGHFDILVIAIPAPNGEQQPARQPVGREGAPQLGNVQPAQQRQAPDAAQQPAQRQPVARPIMTPLPNRIRIDGQFYAIDVKPDGREMTLMPVAVEYGTLAFGGAVNATFISDNGPITERANDGNLRLPEGNYAVQRMSLTVRDDTGASWAMTLSNPSEALRHLVVRPNEVTQVDVGHPITVRPGVRKTGDRTFELTALFLGRGGEAYQPGFTKNGQRIDPPTFRVLDRHGKVVDSGAFAYG